MKSSGLTIEKGVNSKEKACVAVDSVLSEKTIRIDGKLSSEEISVSFN